MKLGRTTQILRIFDLVKAKEFYVDFPVYIQRSRGDCIVRLSEHHGYASPTARVMIATTGIVPFGNRLTFSQAKPDR